ncbi:hypothetical protein D9M69_331460 [compost metagenome]
MKLPPSGALKSIRLASLVRRLRFEEPVSFQRLVSRIVTSEVLPAAVRAEPVTSELERSMLALPSLSNDRPTPCHWPVPMSGMLLPALASERSTFSHWPLPPTMALCRSMSATPATAMVAPS